MSTEVWERKLAELERQLGRLVAEQRSRRVITFTDSFADERSCLARLSSDIARCSKYRPKPLYARSLLQWANVLIGKVEHYFSDAINLFERKLLARLIAFRLTGVPIRRFSALEIANVIGQLEHFLELRRSLVAKQLRLDQQARANACKRVALETSYLNLQAIDSGKDVNWYAVGAKYPKLKSSSSPWTQNTVLRFAEID